jgi:uncharacterized membrane protein
MPIPRVYAFRSPRAEQPAAQATPPMSAADKNISDVVRLEHEAFGQRSFGEQFADAVTAVATRPWFIGAHLLLFGLWIAANTSGGWSFDPWPFNFLNTAITLEAIFLTLLVLASQHRMSRIIDRRAHLNLQVDLLAEQEMTVMLRMLERLFQHFHLDPATSAPQAAEMRKMTDLEALVNKLDSGLDQHPEKLVLNRDSTPAAKTGA